MAASDVLAQFMPDLAKAKGYAPDPQLQAQLIQNITDAQLQRIKQMGDLQAESAGAPFRGIQTLLSSGKEGYQMGEKTKETNSRLAEEQARTEGQQTQNKRSNLSLQAEEQYQDWLDQPKDGANPDGPTRRDMLNQTGYESDLLKNDATRSKMHIEEQDAANRTKQVTSEVAAAGFNLKSAKEQLEAAHFAQAADTIIYDPSLSDQDKQAKLKQLTASGQHEGGMDPKAYNMLASTAWTHYQTAKSAQAQAAQGKEQATELSKPYQDLTAATGKVLSGVGQVNALHQQLGNYQNSLNFGPIHSEQAKAAIAGFVGTLRQMGVQGDDQAAKLADYIESSNPLNGATGDRMAKVVNIMSQRVQDRWSTEYEPQINPDLRQRPEYQQASQAVQKLSGLSTAGKRQKNSSTLFGAPGQTSTVNNGSFTNPQKPQGAVAAPAPPAPQAPAFSPMPNGATVTPPGFVAPPPPPQFNPALRQPLQGQ